MAGLKNWTVTAESTRSAAAREIYLTNAQHKNHINTERIHRLHGKDSAVNIIRNCESYKLEQSRAKKGGRPPTEAMEFVFSLPKGIRPKPQEWRDISKKLIKGLSNHLGVKAADLLPITRAVVHMQNQDESKKGSGDHLHMMVGKFTNDLVYLRELQKKSTIYRLKQEFNNAVLNVMNIDNRHYVPKKTYKGVAKKRAPKWKVDQAREVDQAKELTRRIELFGQQAEKWLEAYEQSNQKQMNRQFNRMEKTLDDMEPFIPAERSEFEEPSNQKLGFLDGAIAPASQFEELLQERVDQMIEKVNEKSDRKLEKTKTRGSSLGF